MFRIKTFRSTILAAICIVALSAGCAIAPDQGIQPGPRVSVADFAALQGEDWHGSLHYRDYSSDRLVSIPVRLRHFRVQGHDVAYRIEYLDEPQYNADEVLVVSADGRFINDERVIARELRDDGNVELTTLSSGIENSQAVQFRNTYRVAQSMFSLRKDVRADGEDDYQFRNELELRR